MPIAFDSAANAAIACALSAFHSRAEVANGSSLVPHDQGSVRRNARGTLVWLIIAFASRRQYCFEFDEHALTIEPALSMGNGHGSRQAWPMASPASREVPMTDNELLRRVRSKSSD